LSKDLLVWIITNRFNLWRGETGANGVGDHPHRDEIQMNKQQKKTKIINVSRIWSKGEKMVWYSLTSGDSPPDFVGEFSHFQFPSGLRSSRAAGLSNFYVGLSNL